ncbi:MAG: hypothetical protein IJL03_01785 [Lachnospiraceae bacterium]|nr:hypothetical protein [Lachnospiraceae bacterium]
MKKKFIALFMILVLGLTCFTACGDKDEDKKSDKKKSAKSYETVYDIADEIQKFKKGTVVMTLDADAGESGIVKGTVNAVCDGKGNYKIGIAADFNTKDLKINVSADDVIIIKDKMAYINLGEILKVADAAAGQSISDMFANMKLGYFAIPLPDDFDTEDAMNVITTFTSGSTDFLKKALKDAEVTGEKGDFTIKFTNAQAYKTFIGATADYVDEKTPELTKSFSAENLSKIDLNAYVKKLLDYYGEDINILAGAFGLEQAQVDALLQQVKALDLNSKAKDALNDEFDVNELASSVKKATDEIRKKSESITDEQIKDSSLELTVKATDTGFKIKGNALVKVDGREVRGDYSIRLSDDVSSISAPSDITRLRDFKDILQNLGGMLGGMMN